MKTFDIALKHLNAVDFNNLINDKEGLKKAVNVISIGYFKDPENTVSNEYYRSLVFEAAVSHKCFIAKGLYSYWNVAQDIITAHKEILVTQQYEGFQSGSLYPKVMVDQWEQYNQQLREKKIDLIENECNLELFMVAFHYAIDNVA